MDRPEQERLFETSSGEVAPPEAGLYLGTCGWSYADWEGTVYPPGTLPAGRLTEYVKHFATVEIDATFYGTPDARPWSGGERLRPRVSSSPPSSRRSSLPETRLPLSRILGNLETVL